MQRMKKDTAKSKPQGKVEGTKADSRAKGSVLDDHPPGEVLRSNLELRRPTSVLLLTLLSMVLLGISFAPFDCWFVAYFALVPWALAMASGQRRVSTILFGWVGGLVFWAGMLYWLTLPTLPGYLGAIVYLSLYWLVASLLMRRAMRRGWPMWITLPVLWVALEFVRARLPVFSFPWFFLAQSQYERLGLIQIADATGQYGVSFFVAMVNGVLIDLLYSPLFVRVGQRIRLAAHIFCGIAVAALVLVGVLLYGRYRLNETPNVTSPGPQVGVVQEAFPLTLDRPPTNGQTFLEAHVRRSMSLVGRGCDLVIWPETMLPTGMNRAVLNLDVRALDDANIVALAMKFFVPASVRQSNPPTLRRALNNRIGPESWDRYRSSAVRFLLRNFFDEAQFDRLDGATLKTLAVRLWGPKRVRGVSPASLRLALLLHLPGPPAAWTQSDPKTIRTAAGLVLNAPAAENVDLPELIRRVRTTVAGQEALDKGRIEEHRRGRACLVEACSIVLGCPILAGGMTFQRNLRSIEPGEEWVFQNSVLWYDASGAGETEYAKVFLVPFSEYVPGKYDWPDLYRVLRGFVPEAMPQIEPGKVLTRFPIHRGGHTWQVVTPVCFEGTIARLCRKMIAAGPKDHLLMANLSNDGWFVMQPRQAPARGTTAHMQHLVHSVFRAIENRVPVVRSVNTGMSAFVTSTGKIESILELRIDEYRKRTMIAGVLEGMTLVDRRRTLYSRYGDIFALLVSLPALCLTVVLTIRKTVPRKET